MAVIKRSSLPYQDPDRHFSNPEPTSFPVSHRDRLLKETAVVTGPKVTLSLLQFDDEPPAPSPETPSSRKALRDPLPPKQRAKTARPDARALTFAEIESMKRDAFKDLELQLQSEQDAFYKTLESEKERLFKAAKEAGFSEGLESGKAAFNALSQDLMQAISSLESEKKNLLRYTEKAAVELGLAIGQKVIQRHLDSNPDTIASIVNEAISKVTEKDKVSIRIHPSHVDSIRKYKETFKRELNDFKQLDIIEDAAIQPGGCVIETNLGYIDSNVTTKIETIQKAMDSIYKKQNPDLVTASEANPIDPFNQMGDDFNTPDLASL